MRIDLASVQRKLVADGRGGYCYEHNLLFRSLLEALGFRVKSYAGHVLWGRDGASMPPRTHMMMLVELDHIRYLADVGFGGMTLSAPIVLQANLEQITPHGVFRLLDADSDGTALPAYVVLQARVEGQWVSIYRFDLDPRYQADYEMSNHYVSTWHDSIFVHNLLAARLAPGKRIGLFNRAMRVLAVDLGIRLLDVAADTTQLDTVLGHLP